MADFDDLQLDRPARPPEPGRQSRGLPLLLTIVAIVGLGVAGYFLWTRQPTPKVSPSAARPQPPPVQTAPVAGESIELPPLGQSDALVRQLVGRLSSHARVAQWLATDQLVRNFTVVVTNIANGHTPTAHLQKMRPTGDFVVSHDEQGTFIDPASYQRYDTYADAVSGLDPQGTARVYETLKPRIQEAYRELGYPEGDFDAALRRAIVLLLQTPVVEGRIDVAGAGGLYSFTDDRLEALDGAQRQLLRMGPRNERLVQDELRAIAPLVGIPPQELPPSRVIHEGGSG
ncbi:MAG: DUF3014 domain-containing protein [Betaproteobacteria bacterium]